MKNRIMWILWSFLVVWMANLAAESAAQETGRQAHGIAREHYYQGVFYGKQENYNEAILELEKAIQVDPAYAEAYNALAVVYHRQKQYQQAIQNYLLAIETSPRYVKARTNLAMIYEEQGQPHKALQQLEQALQEDPAYEPAQKLIETVRKKAQAQEAKERLQQQAQAAARASEVPPAQPTPKATPKPPAQPTPKPTPSPVKDAAPTPSSPPSAFTEGTQLIRRGRLDAGIQAYQQALQRTPHSAEGYALLGLAARQKYHLTHDPAWREQEINSLTKALEYDPNQISALLGLGELHYEQGLLSTAFSYFRQALQLAPAHPARDQLETILRYAQ